MFDSRRKSGGRGSITSVPLTGTALQIDWAEGIRTRVAAEFSRVWKAFSAVAATQQEPALAETLAIIAILEEKRAEVLTNKKAGYFIHDWAEAGDQVRQLIGQDARFLRIVADRRARRQG